MITIDLHRNWRSRKIRKALKAKSYVIRKLTVEKSPHGIR